MVDSKNFKISIITVVYNGAAYLEEAIQSVLNQGNRCYEYIVIDGGSTDGTLDIIKKYERDIDTWISEPDRGLYDAMNKGIRISSGDIIGIVNSDDRLKPRALESVRNAFAADLKLDYVYGDVERIRTDGTVYSSFKAVPPSLIKKKCIVGFQFHMGHFL